jgi:hypothetical protein
MAPWKFVQIKRSAFFKALILVPCTLAGCYLPNPAELPTIATGEEVRLTLSEDGVNHLREISAETLGEINGRLQGLTEDSVTITTRLRGPSYAGPTLGDLRQTLTFGRIDVLEVTVPKLDRVRTTAVVGVIAVAARFLIPGFFKLLGNSQGPDAPPDPTPLQGGR